MGVEDSTFYRDLAVAQHLIKTGEDLVEKDIRDMAVGGTGFVVPWAVRRDKKGRDWIDGDYDFTQYPMGTQGTYVRREADFFEVHLSHTDAEEILGNPVPAEWADEQDPDNPTLLPARIL